MGGSHEVRAWMVEPLGKSLQPVFAKRLRRAPRFALQAPRGCATRSPMGMPMIWWAARLRQGLRRAPRFALQAPRGCATRSPKGEAWWSQAGSNRRPLACHASALPAELWPLNSTARLGRRTGMTLNHSSGLISSLFVAADVANDVGDVLVAFFLVGNEGRIIIVIVFDGLVDLDVVFRFGNRRP